MLAQIDPLRLALAILTCYRLALLLGWEEGPMGIFKAMRARMGANEEGEQNDTLLSRFAVCPYCWGIWLAGLLSFAVAFPFPLTDLVLLIFGIAGAQAYLQGTSN